MKAKVMKVLSLCRRGFVCPVCGSKVRKFKMIGESYLKQFETSLFPHSIFAFETLNVLGYSCPRCAASDRARLYKLYIDRHMAWGKGATILDIAPDPMLGPYLKSHPDVSYRSADISGDHVDDNVDITAMTAYRDNSFDFILCSHVLEHVSDDAKAIAELFRVLKPGGKAIVMAPILLTIDETDEDATVVLPEERLSRFGQEDHVRLYSKKGFTERLAAPGFVVKQYGVEFFGAETFLRHGIAERSVLYVVEKQ